MVLFCVFYPQLQDKLATIEEQHAAQVEGMKREIAALTSDLHQRNLSIASISDKAATAERHLRDQNEALERRRAEVQVICTIVTLMLFTDMNICDLSLDLSFPFMCFWCPKCGESSC